MKEIKVYKFIKPYRAINKNWNKNFKGFVKYFVFKINDYSIGDEYKVKGESKSSELILINNSYIVPLSVVEEITGNKLKSIVNKIKDGDIKQKLIVQIELATCKSTAEELWKLLDDIDTASDIFKPSVRNGIKTYDNFYKYAMKKSALRHKLLMSDGYSLFPPEKLEKHPKRKVAKKELMKFNIS